MATSTTSTSSPRGDAPPKCRYPLDDDSSDTMTLPDGRKLGYAQYGQLTGKPIFWLHGLPGSRTEAAYFHDIGLELGVRMIGTDRPGMGLSTPSPGRTLLDWPKDLECLAEHLGIEEYAVVVLHPLLTITLLYLPSLTSTAYQPGRLRRRPLPPRLRVRPGPLKTKMHLHYLRHGAPRHRHAWRTLDA